MCEGGKCTREKRAKKEDKGLLWRGVTAAGGKWELKRTSNDPLKRPPSGSDGASMVHENQHLERKVEEKGGQVRQLDEWNALEQE